MALESINLVADQQTQNLLAFSGAIMQSRMTFFENAVNQQITDLIENPSDPTEVLAHINTSAAALRGSQAPIQPDPTR
jgi:hypothetical protein